MALQIIIINVKLGPRFSPSLLRQNTRLNSIAHLGPEALCVFLSCSIQCFSFLILALSAVVHCLLGTQCLFFHLNYLFPMLCLAHSALVHGAVFFNIEGPCSSQGSNLQGAIQQDDITSMLLVETSLPGLQEGIPAPGGPNKTPICAYTQVWYSSYFDLAGTATKERA
jgi:hypothetical protein